MRILIVEDEKKVYLKAILIRIDSHCPCGLSGARFFIAIKDCSSIEDHSERVVATIFFSCWDTVNNGIERDFKAIGGKLKLKYKERPQALGIYSMILRMD